MTTTCSECGLPFNTNNPERDVCFPCEREAVREHAPELLAAEEPISETPTPSTRDLGHLPICCRAAVLAERQRVLKRLHDDIQSWKRPENLITTEEEISSLVVAAFEVFSLCLTHAGVDGEEGIVAALGRTEPKPPVTR